MKILIGLVSFIFLGCSIKSYDVNKSFYFEYNDLNESKEELWRRGRNYFAITSTGKGELFEVSDMNQGVIIGETTISLPYFFEICSSRYSYVLIVEKNKARLQIDFMDINAALSKCKANEGESAFHKDLISEVNSIRKQLGKELKGQGHIKYFL